MAGAAPQLVSGCNRKNAKEKHAKGAKGSIELSKK